MNKKEPNTAHVESSGQEMEAIQKDEGNIHKRASDIVARLTSSWTLLHNKESEKNVPRFQLSGEYNFDLKFTTKKFFPDVLFFISFSILSRTCAWTGARERRVLRCN